MFIVFGTRNKTRETAQGAFFCPVCKTTRHYIQKESASYFALYFIPLFKMGQPNVYIECQSCQRVFNPDILNVDSNHMKVLAVIADAEKEIKGGTPSHIIYRKMLAWNIPEEIAKPLSLALLGPRPKICKSCASLYCAGVSACSNCGGELVDNQDPVFWEQKHAADRFYNQMGGKG